MANHFVRQHKFKTTCWIYTQCLKLRNNVEKVHSNNYSLSTLNLPIFVNQKRHIYPLVACCKHRHFRTICTGTQAFKLKHNSDRAEPLFKPVEYTENNITSDVGVAEDLVGQLNKDAVFQLVSSIFRNSTFRQLSKENGLDEKLFYETFKSFRKLCAEAVTLNAELHIVLSDLLRGHGHIDNLWPYFLQHARIVYPHLECMEELKEISDLTKPANWYPEARKLHRRIVYHAGPTNSGKTHQALNRYIEAKSGVYCGPLKLLACEVFAKCNNAGALCDLVTGEERRYAVNEETPANHVACTVEMTRLDVHYEVAVIDEIQMLRDGQRGWAWCRALLGVQADEVHVCGEGAAIDLVRSLCLSTGDDLEVNTYKRLTPLKVLNKAVKEFENIQPGDCIVCFSKNDIFKCSRELEKHGKECAVIYGTLPPGTKLAQAEKFNDSSHPCKYMVATDAIGMGLNLSIKRIIFYSLVKPMLNENGDKELCVIHAAQAKQIGGRAGRYGTCYEKGEVTTMFQNDLAVLKRLWNTPIEPVELAGVHPTADQMELFAYHLPNATLANLVDIFISISNLDDQLYFLCQMDDFKFLCNMIQHIPLALRSRYIFCCAPINNKMAFVCTMFVKFARQYSRNEQMTCDWLYRQLGWPKQIPMTIGDLMQLEETFDVLDLYLWLSYRFQDIFLDTASVHKMREELDEIIQTGVEKITSLVQSGEASKNDITINNGKTLNIVKKAGTPNSKERLQKLVKEHGKSLSQTLIDTGVLNTELLSQLKSELAAKEISNPTISRNDELGQDTRDDVDECEEETDKIINLFQTAPDIKKLHFIKAKHENTTEKSKTTEVVNLFDNS